MYDQSAKSFTTRLRETFRLGRLAVRLTRRASPRLLLGILLLLLLQSALPPLELALSKAVLDRAALDLRLGGQPGELASRLPLAAWIALMAACSHWAGSTSRSRAPFRAWPATG